MADRHSCGRRPCRLAPPAVGAHHVKLCFGHRGYAVFDALQPMIKPAHVQTFKIKSSVSHIPVANDGVFRCSEIAMTSRAHNQKLVLASTRTDAVALEELEQIQIVTDTGVIPCRHVQSRDIESIRIADWAETLPPFVARFGGHDSFPLRIRLANVAERVNQRKMAIDLCQIEFWKSRGNVLFATVDTKETSPVSIQYRSEEH